MLVCSIRFAPLLLPLLITLFLLLLLHLHHHHLLLVPSLVVTGQRSAEAIHEQLGSPPMQQAIQRLETVLQSSQMHSLLAQFGLPNLGQIGVGAFLRAIEQQARGKKEDGAAKPSSGSGSGSGNGGSCDSGKDDPMQP